MEIKAIASIYHLQFQFLWQVWAHMWQNMEIEVLQVKSGSADMLEALGINLNLSLEDTAKCLKRQVLVLCLQQITILL